MFNLQQAGDNVLGLIKRQTWFPYRSGRLKFHATRGYLKDPLTYCIHFDSSVAPYIEYLEKGTSPHNIPRAFGKDLPFGTSGRFNGKFHPGSTKHKGFISQKCVNAVIRYFLENYRGEVEKL